MLGIPGTKENKPSKKAAANKTDANVIKGTDAEKLAKANKQVDSLKLIVLYLESDIEKCKKNSLVNNTEAIKKAEADKAKAESDARLAKKQSDSLSNILIIRTTEYENCKKNSTLNSAEIVKKAEGCCKRTKWFWQWSNCSICKYHECLFT